MYNAFVFDGRPRIRAYLWKLKVVSVCQFCFLLNESWNSFPDGVSDYKFINNSTCPTTNVEVASHVCGTILVLFRHLLKLYVPIERERGRERERERERAKNCFNTHNMFIEKYLYIVAILVESNMRNGFSFYECRKHVHHLEGKLI